MFALVDPHPRFHRSFLAAADEFAAAGEDRYANLVTLPAEPGFAGVDFTRTSLEAPEVFARFTRFLVSQREPGGPRPAGRVPATELWMADGDEYLGRISVRHELTDLLLTWGGHVGYAVRPSARRRGYAAAALASVLPRCVDLRIDPVLVTCDTDNAASRRTIEVNGGVYEDTREGKLRYWVPSSDRSRTG